MPKRSSRINPSFFGGLYNGPWNVEIAVSGAGAVTMNVEDGRVFIGTTTLNLRNGYDDEMIIDDFSSVTAPGTFVLVMNVYVYGQWQVKWTFLNPSSVDQEPGTWNDAEGLNPLERATYRKVLGQVTFELSDSEDPESGYIPVDYTQYWMGGDIDVPRIGDIGRFS